MYSDAPAMHSGAPAMYSDAPAMYSGAPAMHSGSKYSKIEYRTNFLSVQNVCGLHDQFHLKVKNVLSNSLVYYATATRADLSTYFVMVTCAQKGIGASVMAPHHTRVLVPLLWSPHHRRVLVPL